MLEFLGGMFKDDGGEPGDEPSPEPDDRVRSLAAQLEATERERRRLAEELRQADERKSEFLATLAHELRNPLAPIRSALHLMRAAPTDAATLEMAGGIMERQVGQMVRLIDDLLEVSRLNRNVLAVQREGLDLGAAIRSAVEAVGPAIGAAAQELVVSLPAEPLPVDGDFVRLTQVFSNLLDNASKYSPRGSRIELRAAREGDEIAVSIRDEGTGIPADMLTKIFEMFVQVDRTIDRAHGGLGIGLTLVQRVVEMHGGRVEAQSEGRLRGSTFVVHLPAARALAAPPPEPARADEQDRQDADAEIAASGHAPGEGLRVVVVDDNVDAANSLAMLLRLLGHDTRMAFDGPAAIELVASYAPDVMFLDIGMPAMSGVDVARRIRAEPWGRALKLVAVTGWGQEEDQERTRQSGFDRHLVKPVDLSDLRAFLESARRQREAAAP